MLQIVADLCQGQKVTVADLVAKTGLDEGKVTAIMLGRWTPSPSERQKIATALNSSIDDIAWGHVTPIQHLYGHGPG